MQAFEARLPPLEQDAEGSLRVAGSRVSLDSVVAAFDLGATPEEILLKFPSLDLTTVYEVIAYVLRNRQAVDQYISGREQQALGTRAEVEKRFPPDGLRARLLARGAADRRGP